MTDRDIYSSDFTFFAGTSQTFGQLEGNDTGGSNADLDRAIASSNSDLPHPSLFSNGASTSSGIPLHARRSSSSVTNTLPMISSDSPRTDVTSPQPLSTLAGRQSPAEQSGLGTMENMSSTPHRPRIPRAEKDADDTSSPVQSQDPFTRPDATSHTLSRLFAVTTTETRSTPVNAPIEFKSRNLSTKPVSLAGHLYTQGLLSGKHSDIAVTAFGCTYRLHRLMLARAPFFNTALSGQWLESSSDTISLHPEEVDSNITQVCFELALKRLYGATVPNEEAVEAMGLFATGCWLEMHDLIDSSIEAMLRHMTPATLNPLVRLVTSNYYGRAGDQILASAKAMLCRDGWKMPLKNWDGIPADIIREIVGGDGFYANGEWDRWVLAKRILNRRLRNAALEMGLVVPGTRRILEAPDVVKLMAIRFDAVYRKNYMRTATNLPENAHRWVSLYTHPDVEPLLVLLDEGIHYVHLDYEHLQYIRKSTDIFGLPIMPEKVISDALWMQLELRQRVLNAHDNSLELGLSHIAEESPRAASEEFSPVTPRTKKGKARESDVSNSTRSEDDLPSNSWDGNGRPRKFWIPSTDCNIVMGCNAEPVIATSPPSLNQRHISRLSTTLQPEDVQWASDFSAASADNRPLPPLRPSSAQPQIPPAAENKPVVYTHFPPFRFAAEFPNSRLLKEKKRVYSRTFFYAGSLWNIYIQKVRSSKNPQLGVYLHRAKDRETDDVAHVSGTSQGTGISTVDERIGLLEREMLLRRDHLTARQRLRQHRSAADPDLSTSSPAPATAAGPDDDEDDSSGSDAGARSAHRLAHSSARQRLLSGAHRKSRQHFTDPRRRSTSSDDRDSDSDGDGDGGGGGRGADDSLVDDDAELARLSAQDYMPALPGYVDPRPTIKTYFKIYSPSKGGRMLSVYESAPDQFNFSQSWGWKSSTLMLDEGLGVGTDEEDAYAGAAAGYAGGNYAGATAAGDYAGEEQRVRARRTEGRLRFMVVIGNV